MSSNYLNFPIEINLIIQIFCIGAVFRNKLGIDNEGGVYILVQQVLKLSSVI